MTDKERLNQISLMATKMKGPVICFPALLQFPENSIPPKQGIDHAD